jgi:hypothetical protein
MTSPRRGFNDARFARMTRSARTSAPALLPTLLSAYLKTIKYELLSRYRKQIYIIFQSKHT